jgi:hypothetical protein
MEVTTLRAKSVATSSMAMVSWSTKVTDVSATSYWRLNRKWSSSQRTLSVLVSLRTTRAVIRIS